jgi:hypothetical protein
MAYQGWTTIGNHANGFESNYSTHDGRMDSITGQFGNMTLDDGRRRNAWGSYNGGVSKRMKLRNQRKHKTRSQRKRKTRGHRK